MCVYLLPLKIKPCDNKYAPKQSNNGNDTVIHDVDKVTLKSRLAQMAVVPNPAQDQTRVDYVYSEAGSNRYLEMYDVTGRLMARHAVYENSGSWEINLSSYAAGMYVVVLRENGKVLLQSKLSVVR
ncbi:MAG: T9SS type A sorting domain-containing protein [Bacteroidetes bacterium]|nr:T9SS type A sorting domain-containing protein [Bacteroidota bacterium]